METRYKERLQRYESMADDKYQRKMLIWSDTLKLCQTVNYTTSQRLHGLYANFINFIPISAFWIWEMGEPFAGEPRGLRVG